MIFVINNLKYDTDKMDLISEKCEWSYNSSSRLLSGISFYGKDLKLYKSRKGNWLLTYKSDYDKCYGEALSEHEVKSLLIRYDLEVYERIFGMLEEA